MFNFNEKVFTQGHHTQQLISFYNFVDRRKLFVVLNLSVNGL